MPTILTKATPNALAELIKTLIQSECNYNAEVIESAFKTVMERNGLVFHEANYVWENGNDFQKEMLFQFHSVEEYFFYALNSMDCRLERFEALIELMIKF